MRVWIGGEVAQSVYDAFRVARNALEREVNAHLASLPLDDRIRKWALIPILLGPETELVPIIRFDRRSRVAEIRLPLDLSEFAAVSLRVQLRQLATLLRQSFREAGHHGIPSLSVSADLLQAAVGIAEEKALASLARDAGE